MLKFPFPDWQPLYHEAVFELNPEKLTLRVGAAREVIHSRLATVGDHRANVRERNALLDALDVLDIVLEIEGIRTADPPMPQPQSVRPAA